MDKYFIIGILAQFFTSVAGDLYLLRTIQGHNKPNVITWTIWALLGCTFAIITIANQKADFITKIFSVILAVFPTLIAIVALKKGTIEAVGYPDKVAGFLAIVAIIIWFITKNDVGLMPLIITIIADIFAMIPTLRFVFKSPADDRPGAWIAFSFGSMITILSLEKWNPESYLLPLYMAIASLTVAYPLVIYRIHKKIPWRDWIWARLGK